MDTRPSTPQQDPLGNLEQWDEFLGGRYKQGKSESEFRQYDAKATPGVAEFCRLNHQYQTRDYVLAKENEYFGLERGKKSIWEAAEYLNALVDDSQRSHQAQSEAPSW
jgi:inositol oxygenase